MKKRIGFVTCKDLSSYFPSQKNPLFTHDDQAAVDYLEERELDIIPIIWGTPSIEIEKLNLKALIVRSPWDYMDNESNQIGFKKWLEDLPPMNVENNISLMLWNMDKRYLLDFKEQGVDIVETAFLDRNEGLDLAKIFREKGPYVIKPTISAAAKDTYRVLNLEQAESLKKGTHKDLKIPFESIRSGRDFLLQPYIQEITVEGEWSLIFLNGEYTHSVLKIPEEGGWYVQDEKGGSVHCLKAPEKVQEKATIAFNKIQKAFKDSHFFLKGEEKTLKHHPLYARIDIIKTKQGFKVSEVEMVEPELFFLYREKGTFSPHQEALEKFYQGIKKRIEHL